MSDLIENRHIRVFISSTFQDMQGERNYLMNRTFPILRKLAAARDVTLTELDLRWGITKEESENGKTVEICLREIENSVPFFMGIVGNRYGWIPKKADINENVLKHFPEVGGYIENQLSVTDMEIQFGVLNRKADMYAYFYIKNQEEDSDSPEKLKDLKSSITASKYPSEKYDSLEDLGIKVEKSFKELLDKLYPVGEIYNLEKVRLAQSSFMHELTQCYVPLGTFSSIDEWLYSENSSTLVITGDTGVGKSALLANWIKENSAKESFPYRIICAFLGHNGYWPSATHIYDLLFSEIAAECNIKDGRALTEEAREADKINSLLSLGVKYGKKPLLIILDGMNTILNTHNEKTLFWLQAPPKDVKILITTVKEDPTYDVCIARNYWACNLLPFDDQKKKEFVINYLSGIYAKKLTDVQINKIAKDPQMDNPRTLKMLLDELATIGIFEQLDDQIDYFLAPDTLEGTYEAILDKYEEEFGLNLIRHALSLLYVTDKSLDENGIMEIMNDGCPINEPRVPILLWSQLYCAFSSQLTDYHGMIDFAHPYLRKAVWNRYLKNDKGWERKCREEIITLCKKSMNERAIIVMAEQYDVLQMWKELHELLMDVDRFCIFYDYAVDKLRDLWAHLIDAGYTPNDYPSMLRSCRGLTSLGLAEHMSTFFTEHIIYPELALVLLQSVEHLVKEEFDEVHYYEALAKVYNRIGKHDKEIECYFHSIKASDSIINGAPPTAMSYESIALAYIEMGEYDRSMTYFKKALKVQKSVNWTDPLDTTRICILIANEYFKKDNYGDALTYYYEALALKRKCLGDNHAEVASLCVSIAISFYNIEEFKDASAYAQKAKTIFEYIEQTDVEDYTCALEILEESNKQIKMRSDYWKQKKSDLKNFIKKIFLQK